MDEDLIRKINLKCPYGQGIFFQPNGVPTSINEHVIYSQYVKSGKSGGSCWGTEPEWFYNEPPKDHMKVLDIVLEEVCPNITFLQYKKLSGLIRSNDEYCADNYYGNFDNWHVDFIPLSEFEEFINNIK